MESQQTPRRFRIPPMTALTMVVLVILFLIHTTTGEFKADDHTIRPRHGFHPSKWYKFFTSPLVHKNLLYLTLSLVGLGVIGTRLERKLGTMMMLFTQVIVWIGTVATFCFLGTFLYFLTAYDSWMEVKHTGFGPMLFGYAVIDSYLGHRDTFRILLPWLLAPLIPMALPRVSILSALAGCAFGFLLARDGLGRMLLPNREFIVRAEQSWFGQTLQSGWSSFCPVWEDTAKAPFDETMEGSTFSDSYPTRETARLVPLSSKEASAANTATTSHKTGGGPATGDVV